ncbi:hypothetical protein BASA81_003925 [Batrachochytrium salamandrivorans]|nr:hypothetical protein BASA81_003925 [Batrachochytrium salamandrivorans]
MMHHPQKLVRWDTEVDLGEMKFVKNVFIVGGTHGNERGGVHLAKAFNLLATWPNLSIQGVVANERAVVQNTRYVDEDLNRCFTLKRLEAKPTTTYESQRALELNALLGPKSLEPSTSAARADFIFDLHNSTSNTGMMLCLHRNDLLAREVAAHLQTLDPQIKIVHWSKELGDDQPFLPTMGKSGMTVELGSVCHGTTNLIAMERVKLLLDRGLAYLNRRAGLTAQELENQLQVKRISIGERLAQVDFPRNPVTGDAAAFIHSKLQGMEELGSEGFLIEGQTLFAQLDGTPVIKFDSSNYPKASNNRLYPVFVNEAAYFEKQTAFFLYELIEGMEVRVLV